MLERRFKAFQNWIMKRAEEYLNDTDTKLCFKVHAVRKWKLHRIMFKWIVLDVLPSFVTRLIK